MSRALTILFPLLILGHRAAAQAVPAGFVVDTLVSSGLYDPVDLAFLPDGRCLIANITGEILVYAGGSAVQIGSVPNIELGNERGLLSIAADPGFASNGFVYVYYSSNLDAFLHLDRFACTGDLGNPASTNLTLVLPSQRAVLGTLPDVAINHNGGSLRFGPDGMLYLSVGDDADECSSQLLASEVGCVLRLDVSALPSGGSLALPPYSALDPGTNPLSANNDFSQLVIAHGLRNPFRMEIDALTGNIYLGDVGASAVEEYDEYVYQASGLSLVNFGWPWREGNIAGPSGCAGSPPPGLVDPIAVVPQTAGWVSLMGGARYRNLGGASDFGPAYEGDAFFLDYSAGGLRRLRHTGQWGLAPPVAGQPTATEWGNGFEYTTCLRLGPDGSLWFTQQQGLGLLKRVRRGPGANSVTVVAGDGQRGAAGETFAQPLVVRLEDQNGNAVVGGQVAFAVAGPGAVATANPVLTNANGEAQASIAAGNQGGAIAVSASTPNGLAAASFQLFARKLAATTASSFLILSIANQTDAVPPQVPYVVLMSLPGSPTLPTILGPLCVDPGYALALVIEDGLGMFGGVSFSGSGGIGAPNLNAVYALPPGIFAGLVVNFQAVGFDAIDGWFRTNCEPRLF
jgi:glucose/arabinose dehydrogenase